MRREGSLRDGRDIGGRAPGKQAPDYRPPPRRPPDRPGPLSGRALPETGAPGDERSRGRALPETRDPGNEKAARAGGRPLIARVTGNAAQLPPRTVPCTVRRRTASAVSTAPVRSMSSRVNAWPGALTQPLLSRWRRRVPVWVRQRLSSSALAAWSPSITTVS